MLPYYRQQAYLTSCRPRKFVVGHMYEMDSDEEFKSLKVVQFIQVSPKGYNFLDILTGKCVRFEQHWYASKQHENTESEIFIWIKKTIYTRKFNLKEPEI